jgi:transposase-like protein
MGQKQHVYNDAFKSDIVRLVIEGKQRVSAVCKVHNLPESRVYAWVKAARDAGKPLPPNALNPDERKELLELRKKNFALERECDFLKKATAYFAKANG